MTPSRIGKYEIQRRLGAGGMGSLYLARDPGLERLVAIKTLRDEYQDDPELRERFTREARSVARLRHPNIIIVFEIGEFDGQPFIAMEYIAGETLTSVLRRQPPLPLPRRLGLIEDLCLGLAHAHGAGIIHRDIKPANIMLDGDGVLKILDFGIARHGDSGMTQDGMMMGTVNYMSPEQVVGHGVDHRSDIFAAGAVLYELIALEQAFPGRIDSGVLQRILSDGPIPLEERVPDLDAELARIVRHALEREPKRRYQDANVMRRDLARVRRRLVELGSSDAATEAPTTGRPRSASPGDNRRADSDRPRRLNPERFAELQRQQVDEYLQFAQEALARGDHDAALQHAERAATVDPDSRAAFDLIDKARFAIEAKAIRQLLAEAQRLISDGQVDDAAALTDEASVTLPDIEGAVELQEEVRRTVERIAAAREREQRITASLERARSSIDEGGYETALRAVYEVLALDPERPEARALEQQAQSQLQAQRHHERARHDAYEQLKRARTLAAEGRFDAAVAAVNAVSAPSDTVRLAAAEVLTAIEKAQRQSAQAAVIAQARDAFAHENYAGALAAIDSIPAEDQTPEARTLRASVEEALRAQREAERKRASLDAALTAVQSLIDGGGDLGRARQRLEDAVRIGLEDPRLAVMRRQIADLETAAQERRQQEARDRLAAKRVEAARQLLTNGDGYAAVALLEKDGSGHPLVEQTLREMRVAIADQEARVRQAAERQRHEEEARRRAEQEAARLLEDRRKAEEQARAAAERQAQLAEEARVRAAERQALEEAVTGFLTRVQQEEAHEVALAVLADARTLAPDDPRIRTLITERRAALDRQRADEQRRIEETRLREEEQRLAEQRRAQDAERQRQEEEKRREEQRRQEQENRRRELLAAEERARLAEQREQERAAQLERDAHAAAVVMQARGLFAAGQHGEALALLRSAAAHALTQEALDDLESQRLTIARQHLEEERRQRRRQRRIAVVAAVRHAAEDRRWQAAGMTVCAGVLVLIAWRFVPAPNRTFAPETGEANDAGTVIAVPQEADTGASIDNNPARGPVDPSVVPESLAPAATPRRGGAGRSGTPQEPSSSVTGDADLVGAARGANIVESESPAGRGPIANLAEPQGTGGGGTVSANPETQGSIGRGTTAVAIDRPAPGIDPGAGAGSRPAEPIINLAAERAAIQDLVSQYVTAYGRMDDARLRAIDPTFGGIQGRALIRSVELRLSQTSIDVAPDGQSAVVTASGTFNYVWNRAGFPATTPAQLKWSLRKTGTIWTVAR